MIRCLRSVWSGFGFICVGTSHFVHAPQPFQGRLTGPFEIRKVLLSTCYLLPLWKKSSGSCDEPILFNSNSHSPLTGWVDGWMDWWMDIESVNQSFEDWFNIPTIRALIYHSHAATRRGLLFLKRTSLWSGSSWCKFRRKSTLKMNSTLFISTYVSSKCTQVLLICHVRCLWVAST